MDKVYIRLTVPAIDETMDISVSPELSIEEILKTLIPAIVENSRGRYVSSGKERLSWLDERKVLHHKYSLCDYRIGDGASLLLL